MPMLWIVGRESHRCCYRGYNAACYSSFGSVTHSLGGPFLEKKTAAKASTPTILDDVDDDDDDCVAAPRTLHRLFASRRWFDVETKQAPVVACASFPLPR